MGPARCRQGPSAPLCVAKSLTRMAGFRSNRWAAQQGGRYVRFPPLPGIRDAHAAAYLRLRTPAAAGLAAKCDGLSRQSGFGPGTWQLYEDELLQ